jgi:hypothetical protein
MSRTKGGTVTHRRHKKVLDAAKVGRASGWGSHVGGGEKYRRYAALMAELEAKGATLAGPRTRHFGADGPAEMMRCGLMQWA